MIYSEVVEAGLILPKKKKYTMRDVHAVMVNSLFGPGKQTMNKQMAIYIVKCSAAYHDTDFSRKVDTWSPLKEFLNK